MSDYSDLIDRSDSINRLLSRYGVKFGIYKNGAFKEQLFPYDPIPRIITKAEFDYLEKGLIQRVDALNHFLYDIYHKKQIIEDGIIPADFVFSSKGYLPQCEGITPPGKIYSHISGIDLVQAKDGSWYILEDNLRIPSGASYTMIARELERRAAPEAFRKNPIYDNRNYAVMLKEMMDLYDNLKFKLSDTEYNKTPSPVYQTEILLKHGLIQNNLIPKELEFQVRNINK